jgi:hypothetical protein
MRDLFYQMNILIIFGMPNTRMSSYPYFPHFSPMASLDNFAPGIPNAMLSQSAAKTVAADADPCLPLLPERYAQEIAA